MNISDYLEEERKTKRHHRLAVNYGEEFIKSKGLWEEFLEYAEAEDSKKPSATPPYIIVD